MAITLARLESSGFLPVRHLKILCMQHVLNKDALHSNVDVQQTICNYPIIFLWTQLSTLKHVLILMKDILTTYF
jgi:hypothetical protein